MIGIVSFPDRKQTVAHNELITLAHRALNIKPQTKVGGRLVEEWEMVETVVGVGGR